MTAKIIDYKTGKEIKPEGNKCSFCSRPEHACSQLISNNQNKYICNHCVAKFKEYTSG